MSRKAYSEEILNMAFNPYNFNTITGQFQREKENVQPAQDVPGHDCFRNDGLSAAAVQVPAQTDLSLRLKRCKSPWCLPFNSTGIRNTL